MPTSETALLPMQTVEAVVMVYADAQRDVAEAFRLFQQAQVQRKTFLEYQSIVQRYEKMEDAGKTTSLVGFDARASLKDTV